MTVQSNWRNCQKCQAMFFNGFPKKGKELEGQTPSNVDHIGTSYF